MKSTQNCVICGKRFKPGGPSHTTCSRQCHDRHMPVSKIRETVLKAATSSSGLSADEWKVHVKDRGPIYAEKAQAVLRDMLNEDVLREVKDPVTFQITGYRACSEEQEQTIKPDTLPDPPKRPRERPKKVIPPLPGILNQHVSDVLSRIDTDVLTLYLDTRKALAQAHKDVRDREEELVELHRLTHEKEREVDAARKARDATEQDLKGICKMLHPTE